MGARRPTKAENDAAELLPDPAAADAITRFFTSLGADQSAAVTVYAVDPRNRMRRSFLFTIADATELTGPELMGQILDKYGPGEYMAEGRDVESGQIIFKPRFEVGGFSASRAVVPPPQSAAATPAKPGDTSSELVAAINRQSALLEAVLARQSQQPSMLGMLRELKELRDVIAPPAAAAPAGLDFAKVLELVTGVLDLRDKLGDGGGESGPLSVLARSLAPALTKIAERAVEAQPAGLPAPNGGGVTVTAPAAPAGDQVAASNIMVRTYVAELVRFAKQGLEPEAAARRVLETLAGFPEPMVAAIVDWLDDEAVVANLTAIEPEAANYGAWLSTVVDHVLDAMIDDADDELEQPAAAAAPANGQPAAGG